MPRERAGRVLSLWDEPIPGLCSGDDPALRRRRREIALCHGLSRLAAAGGRLLRPGDVQAGPLVPAVTAALLLLSDIGRCPRPRSDRPGLAVRVIAMRGTRSRGVGLRDDSFSRRAGGRRAIAMATEDCSRVAASRDRFATASVVWPRLGDGCFTPAMQKPSRSRPAASAALLLLYGITPASGPERSPRVGRPRDRNARKGIMPRPTAVLSHSLRIPRPSRYWFATPGPVAAGCCLRAERSSDRGGPAAGRVMRSRVVLYSSRPALACIIGARRAWTVEAISSEEMPCRPTARRP